ncbi:hypothetical protein BsWGS_15597 [Bradybaena similaris]
MDVQTVCCQIVSLTILVYLTQSTQYVRICRSSLDILSAPGAKIENYNKSHVRISLQRYNLSSINNEFRVTFDFRTSSPDGILFYGRAIDSQQYVAISMYRGDIIYTVRCPSLHADITLATTNRFDDGNWHQVEYILSYEHDAATGYLAVDGSRPSRNYTVDCELLRRLYMGGLGPGVVFRFQHGNIQLGHFKGCIRNMFVPVGQILPPKYYAVSVCD